MGVVRLRKKRLGAGFAALVVLLAGAIVLAFALPRQAASDPVHTSLIDELAPRRTALEPLPALEPLLFRPDVDPASAVQMNAAMLPVAGPIPQPRPFVMDVARTEAASRLTALDCLTAAVFYEAASENLTGQRAVAQVVLNRVRHPAYPNSICGVVFQGSERATGCQFTFTCDGSLARLPSQRGWQLARQVAEQALAGYVETSVGTATHYHTVWVVPYWRTNLAKLTTLGAHIFYRWAGNQGQPAAFLDRYSGAEKQPPVLAARLQGFLLAAAEGGAPPNGLIVADSRLDMAATPRLELRRPALPEAPQIAADERKGMLIADERTGTLIAR